MLAHSTASHSAVSTGNKSSTRCQADQARRLAGSFDLKKRWITSFFLSVTATLWGVLR